MPPECSDLSCRPDLFPTSVGCIPSESERYGRCNTLKRAISLTVKIFILLRHLTASNILVVLVAPTSARHMPSELLSYGRRDGLKKITRSSAVEIPTLSQPNHANLFRPSGLANGGRKVSHNKASGGRLQIDGIQHKTRSVEGNFTSVDHKSGRQKPFPRAMHQVFEFLVV